MGLVHVHCDLKNILFLSLLHYLINSDFFEVGRETPTALTLDNNVKCEPPGHEFLLVDHNKVSIFVIRMIFLMKNINHTRELIPRTASCHIVFQ